MNDSETPPIGLARSDLSERIIGVFYEVYNELGHGFLESVYLEAMAIALQEAGLRIEKQFRIPVWFGGAAPQIG